MRTLIQEWHSVPLLWLFYQSSQSCTDDIEEFQYFRVWAMDPTKFNSILGLAKFILCYASTEKSR